MLIVPIENLRWVGIITISIIVVSALIILYVRPLGKNASVSAHLAAGKWQYYIMAIILTLATTTFNAFAVGWLGPFYGTHTGFYIVTAIAWITAYIAAWIPIDTVKLGATHHIHMASAATAGLTLPILVGFIFATNRLEILSTILSLLMMIIAVIFLILYLFFRSTREHFLIYQAIYVTLFALTITAFTFNI